MFEPKVPGGPNFYYQPPVPDFDFTPIPDIADDWSDAWEKVGRPEVEVPAEIVIPQLDPSQLPEIKIPEGWSPPEQAISLPPIVLGTPHHAIQFNMPKIELPAFPIKDPGWVDFLMRNAERIPKAGSGGDQPEAVIAALERLRDEYESTKKETDHADVTDRTGPEEGRQDGPACQGEPQEGAGPPGSVAGQGEEGVRGGGG